ncbi:hypothetical protein ACK8OR_13485 [Jannaschia sp. KMU-145]|uniref:hypothetical protein n=1 Tax=Jannaschia halovivens TaxID=3388667 RepID=UPI00396B3DEF
MNRLMEWLRRLSGRAPLDPRLRRMTDTPRNEYIFFEVPPGETPNSAFTKLTTASDPIHASDGGASEHGCSVETPDGVVYHCLVTNRDVDGWRTDIAAGARHHGWSLAKIEGRRFALDDGRTYPLADCRIAFF